MLNHALLVTCQAPPGTPAQFTHGVYQRFGALLRAAADVAAQLNLLAIYRTDASAISVTAAELEAYYQKFCGVAVKVTKAVIPPADAGPTGRWERVKRGLRDPLDFGPSDRVRTLDSLAPVRQLLASAPDVIIAHKLSGFATLAQLGAPTCPIALDLDDVEHKAALRLLRFPPHYPGKLLALAKPLGLAWLEHVAARESAVTFICSERDKRWLERIIRAPRVMVLPNAVEVRPQVTPVPQSRNVLFVGTLNYQPNAEAAGWFIKAIWPRILPRCPAATLTIAGRCPERVPGFDRAHPSIRFLGFAPDLEPLYEAAQLVVCPIQAGGGTRIKIIEAAMYGRPVVATPVGAEGLDFQPPNEIRIRKDAAGFADECVRLLDDIDACRAVGALAHARAARQYSRDAFITEVGTVLRRITGT